MEELLQNPAVQAGVLPFAGGLVVAVFLRATRQLGVAIAAAFLVAVGLTMGFGLESLTSVKKLALTGIAAAVLGVLLEALTDKPRWPHRAALALAVALAVLWVLQRILSQREAPFALLAGVGAVAYALALLAGAERVARRPVDAAAVALVLGFASGVLAVLGASAQLAQLGIAIGGGAGAVLLVQMFSGTSAPVGWTIGLSAQIAAGLVGLLAVFTGSLPWYCLLPLPLVAWGVSLAPGPTRPIWLAAVFATVVGSIPAVVALALAWFTSSGQPA